MRVSLENVLWDRRGGAVYHFMFLYIFSIQSCSIIKLQQDINRRSIQVLSHAFTTATELGVEELLDVDDVQTIDEQQCILFYVSL